MIWDGIENLPEYTRILQDIARADAWLDSYQVDVRLLALVEVLAEEVSSLKRRLDAAHGAEAKP